MKRRYLSFILILFSIFFFACKTTEEHNIYTQEPFISMSIKEKIGYITQNEGVRKYGTNQVEFTEIDEYGLEIVTIWHDSSQYGFCFDKRPDEGDCLSIIIRIIDSLDYFKFAAELYEENNASSIKSGAIGKINYKTYTPDPYKNNQSVIYELIDAEDESYFELITNLYISVLFEKLSEILPDYNLTLKDFGFKNIE